MRLPLALAILSLAIWPTAAHAGQTCHSADHPSAPTNWSQAFVLPKHDPALGALQSVTVTLRCALTGQVGAENPSPIPAKYETSLEFQGRVRRPGGSEIVLVVPSVRSTLSFGAFDGSIDFGGASGVSLPDLQASRESHEVLTSPADLALFTAASAGETIQLSFDALGTSIATGPGALVVILATNAAIHVDVCYGYREIRQSASVPASPTNWQQPAVFAKHDPAVGPLRAVRLRARAAHSGSVSVENLEPAGPGSVTTRLDLQTSVRRPDSTTALAFADARTTVDHLAPFDGVVDFAGLSGTSHTLAPESASGFAVLTSAADLALFTAGAPGETIALSIVAAGSTVVVGQGNTVLTGTNSAGAELEVVYDHAAPVAPYCFGDGSGTACPCGNASPAGAEQGCLNSLGLGGELRATGFAEIGADTLDFRASNLAANATVLFFQGTSATSATFGDGLRCVGGSVRRLGTRTASGGTAQFPPAGTTISQAGMAATGSTLRYQAWYRNSAAFCTPSTFNLTNALSIAW